MNTHRTRKKNLIVSYKNLPEKLKEMFMEKYPEGYSEHLQRFEKPNGDVIFVVPMETEDTVYMIKFDVKIDTSYSDDETEKDYFDEEVEKADAQFAPLQEALDKEEENTSHTEREVRHGNYGDEMDSGKKRSHAHGSLGELGAELQEAFSDDVREEDYDDYSDKDDNENEIADDDYEPTDEELMDIDNEIYAYAEIPPEEQERMAAEEAATDKTKHIGRPRKTDNEASAAHDTEPKKKKRPRIKKG